MITRIEYDRALELFDKVFDKEKKLTSKEKEELKEYCVDGFERTKEEFKEKWYSEVTSSRNYEDTFTDTTWDDIGEDVREFVKDRDDEGEFYNLLLNNLEDTLKRNMADNIDIRILLEHASKEQKESWEKLQKDRLMNAL